MLSIKGHCSYLGYTGYNYHSRGFFRALLKCFPNLKIRNSTICSKIDEYLNETDKKILSEQTLFNKDGSRSDYKFSWNEDFLDNNVYGRKIHIILNPVNHYYFEDSYNGIKIAYVVWESTLFPDKFFKNLLTYDQLWVPSEWQKNNIIRQGFDSKKVFVVPEGIDDDILKIDSFELSPSSQPFTFLISGRWEYRKFTREIIQSFIDVFGDDKNVKLLLNVDNPFDLYKLSTNEKLDKYNLSHSNIEIIEFLSREKYLQLLKNVNVFLSCSRGEGWNRPLQEVVALGIPCICSNYGAQLEFITESVVKIRVKEQDANLNEETSTIPGQWCEPDQNDLKEKMLLIYKNYEEIRKKAIIDSKILREEYTWERCAKVAEEILYRSFDDHNSVLFVTGGDIKYEKIINKLAQSFNLFSQNKLIIYGINCHLQFNYHNCVTNRLDVIYEKDSDKWYTKQKICIKALKDFPYYSKFVWIDGDSIVNDKIDNIQNYFKNLENYPICDRHYLSEYYFFDIDKNGNRIGETKYNEKLIRHFGIQRNSKILGHACLFIFNHECLSFFEEIINIYENLKGQNNDDIIICNDEGIDNLLRWKYNYQKFLPNCTFETGFNPEYVDEFFIRDGPYDFGNKRGWTHIPKDKESIICFHGNKNSEIAEKIIKLVQKNVFNPHRFIINNLEIDFHVLKLNDVILKVAEKYGWYAAIYHEIYNLHNYTFIPEMQIKRGDIVVDVGANFGAFSRYAIYFGAEQVIAFEPDTFFFNSLKQNIRFKDIPFNCALSDVNEECKLFLSEHVGGSTTIDKFNNLKYKLINCFKLDHFLDGGFIDHIDFLKIDVEGAEIKVLNGVSDKNILKIKKISLEYHNKLFGYSEKQLNSLIDRFQKLGFNFYTLHMGDNNDLKMLYFWQ